MACGKQKGKGGNGSITASSSASSSASIIPLNLGVGCAPSCWPIFGFRPSWVLAGGSEGSFLCSLSSRFSGRGGGGGEPPQGVAASWGARRAWKSIAAEQSCGRYYDRVKGGHGDVPESSVGPRPCSKHGHELLNPARR